jgi:hypothetical protein
MISVQYHAGAAIDYLGDQFLLRCMIAKFHNIAFANINLITASGGGVADAQPPNAPTHRAVAVNPLFGSSHHLSE